MDVSIDSPGPANVFSTLDANSGFWLIELDDNEMHKTRFDKYSGLYFYICVSYQLMNALALFPQKMVIILALVKRQHA